MQRRLGQHDRQQIEEDAEVEHGERQHLGDVPALVVAHLVRQHRHQLGHRMALDQRVEQRDPPAPPDAGEERVGAGRAARSVDDVDAGERKADALGVAQDRGAQLAVGQRLEPVEPGQDPGRVDDLGEQGEGGGGDPAVDPRAAARRARRRAGPAPRMGAAERDRERRALGEVEQRTCAAWCG